MRFSIVTPIYKVEKYLQECIDSVLNQSYSDFELILVDDGSPDNCPIICDRAAKEDERIKVIHKQNGGLSNARNEGLKVAKGEYIVFLDSDDLMCKDALNQIDECLKENQFPDIILGNIIHFQEKTEWIAVDNKKYIGKSADSIYDICELYAHDRVQLPWRAYQSIYKKQLLEENNLYFDENIIGAEDCDFFVRLLPCIKSYVMTDINIIKYRVAREGSIISSPSFHSVLGQLITFDRAYQSADQYKDQELIKCYFAERFVNIIVLIGLLAEKTQQKQCYDFVKNNKEIIRHAKGKKYFGARLVWNIFGYKRGTGILIKVNRLRGKRY